MVKLAPVKKMDKDIMKGTGDGERSSSFHSLAGAGVPLPPHPLSEAEAYWDDSASEDIAGSKETKNIFWKLKKNGFGRFLLFCYIFLDTIFAVTMSKTKARVDTQTTALAEKQQRSRRLCFLSCNVDASAQQLTYDYSAE